MTKNTKEDCDVLEAMGVFVCVCLHVCVPACVCVSLHLCVCVCVGGAPAGLNDRLGLCLGLTDFPEP